jgi:5,5'-dehydrodivanillate O-demethylase
MGNLMRRYWHPVAAVAELNNHQVKKVKVLNESLVICRDKKRQVRVLAESSLHGNASLAHSIPEHKSLRWSYQGWLFDSMGRCVEQPVGPFKNRIRTREYPVAELGGLIFAYLGPEPVPRLPRYNALLWDDAVREINGTVIACNWLQVIENLLDPYHVEFLHGRFFEHVLRLKGGGQLEEFLGRYAPKPIEKIAFDLFENGIIERHMIRSEEEISWKVGAPTFFPSTTLVGSVETSRVINFVVPLDDTHTWFVVYLAERTGIPIPWEETPQFVDVSGVNDSGKFILDTANGQDHMAVVTQGDIARREIEHLTTSDMGITLYRQLLMNQIELMERGGEPMNVYQDLDRKPIEVEEVLEIA